VEIGAGRTSSPPKSAIPPTPPAPNPPRTTPPSPPIPLAQPRRPRPGLPMVGMGREPRRLIPNPLRSPPAPRIVFIGNLTPAPGPYLTRPRARHVGGPPPLLTAPTSPPGYPQRPMPSPIGLVLGR